MVVVVEETQAAAAMVGSLILVSSLDTELAAVKEQGQESFVPLKKLLFDAVKNFSDNSERDIKIKKLMPMDMSRRLIDWMDKVISCFYRRSADGEVKIRMSPSRSKRDSTASNTLELNSDQTRSSACMMIKMPISLMRALDFDAMAEVPEDGEPPCFKFCDDNKKPLMIEVGNIYNKHITALKFKSVPDPGDGISANGGDNEYGQYDYFSYTEVDKVDHYIVSSNDCSQDTYCEVELTAQAKDAFSNFPEILMAYYALSMDCATIANFRGKLKPRMYEAKKFTEKIMKEQDRYEKHADSERSGYILCTNPTAKYWCVDSGASSHICGKSEWITNVRPIPKGKKMCFLNAASKEVRLSGLVDIIGPKIRLYNVYLSNDLEDDELYVSIGQLTGEGYAVLIDKRKVTIRLAKNLDHIVGTGSLDKTAKVYKLEFFNGSVLKKGKGKGNLDKKQGPEYKVAKGDWVLDSGCHNHITCEKSFLNKIWRMKRVKKFGVAGSEHKMSCKVKGNITEGEIRLKDVYYCQGSESNIISVGQLDVLGYNFLFLRDHCQIRYKEEQGLVGLAHADGGSLNYYVEFLNSKE